MKEENCLIATLPIMLADRTELDGGPVPNVLCERHAILFCAFVPLRRPAGRPPMSDQREMPNCGVTFKGRLSGWSVRLSAPTCTQLSSERPSIAPRTAGRDHAGASDATCSPGQTRSMQAKSRLSNRPTDLGDDSDQSLADVSCCL